MTDQNMPAPPSREATDIPSPKAQSALAIVAELERLLDLAE